MTTAHDHNESGGHGSGDADEQSDRGGHVRAARQRVQDRAEQCGNADQETVNAEGGCPSRERRHSKAARIEWIRRD